MQSEKRGPSTAHTREYAKTGVAYWFKANTSHPLQNVAYPRIRASSGVHISRSPRLTRADKAGNALKECAAKPTFRRGVPSIERMDSQSQSLISLIGSAIVESLFDKTSSTVISRRFSREQRFQVANLPITPEAALKYSNRSQVLHIQSMLEMNLSSVSR